ncbi:choice-of-anchor A family protein [Horticoccus luteus]|uniref:Choice-of-anchor A family protein n=1 Tax=Horticoccus luteus TaxID=2862869 RepID=A0A8F9XHG2_9BACT|nr:collagen-binding domain-containing protein [Horticoccus luteus]QYM80212.1 choice-of-anchor A family protein [Horticoccus luteus]
MNRSRLLLSGAALLLSLGSGIPLRAQLTPDQALATYDQLTRSYNVITLGDLTLNNTHTDGGIAVGGNLTVGSGTIIGLFSNPSAGADPALYANGAVTFNGNSQINNGYVSTPAMSGSVTWTYNPAGNNYQRQLVTGSGMMAYNTSDARAYTDPRTVTGPNGWNWSSVGSSLIAVSNALAAANATGTIGVSGQTLTFTSNASGVTVFNLDASRIVNGYYDANGDGFFDQNTERLSDIKANLAADQYFVINVLNATSAGGKILFDGVNNLSGGSNNQQLLWNILPDNNAATPDKLTLSTNFYGSILAPLVDIENNNHYLNGQLVAGSYTQTNAEIHYADGYSGPVVFSPVPEPGTYALVAVGLGFVAVVWRRRPRPRGTPPA